jgi:hypothetical protein
MLWRYLISSKGAIDNDILILTLLLRIKILKKTNNGQQRLSCIETSKLDKILVLQIITFGVLNNFLWKKGCGKL